MNLATPDWDVQSAVVMQGSQAWQNPHMSTPQGHPAPSPSIEAAPEHMSVVVELPVEPLELPSTLSTVLSQPRGEAVTATRVAPRTTAPTPMPRAQGREVECMRRC